MYPNKFGYINRYKYNDVDYNYISSEIPENTIDYEIIDDINNGINNLKININKDQNLYTYDIQNDNMYYNMKNININDDNSINIINLDNISTIDIIDEPLISKRFVMNLSLQDVIIDAKKISNMF